MPELNLDLDSYLLNVYKINTSNITAKDIPNLVLRIMQYIEERIDKGYNKRDFVLEQVYILGLTVIQSRILPCGKEKLN